MQIVTLDKDAKVSAVVTRSYKIEGPGSVAARKRAEAALLQANPHIAGLETVPKGTVVVVPEVPGLARAREAGPADEAAMSLVAELRRGLDDLAETAIGAAKRDLEAAAETQKHLKSRELKTLVGRQAPQASDLLGEIDAGLKDQMREGEALLKSLDQARGQLANELEELEKRLS